ncbi:hypothetical protein D3H35_12725 [Cohnella faecalis]|uniref:Uncharacterized protein n=1 Tax=Cohnella faecalis TaxID=2315694 RepID=A0A398CJL0_9BACL|nr:hypothetical protein D3H35_12725 [Cohnella faecalis]
MLPPQPSADNRENQLFTGSQPFDREDGVPELECGFISIGGQLNPRRSMRSGLSIEFRSETRYPPLRIERMPAIRTSRLPNLSFAP